MDVGLSFNEFPGLLVVVTFDTGKMGFCVKIVFFWTVSGVLAELAPSGRRI
jgi:hypothetical protein